MAREVSRRAIVAVLAPGLLLLALGLWLESTGRVTAWREKVQTREVPERAFGTSPRLKGILLSLGRLHPDFRRYLDQKPASRLVTYSTRAVEGGKLPSSEVVPAELLAKGFPILSLRVHEKDLEDLLANRFQRGRKWERRAYVSYFDRGELLFSAGTGVRLHGGLSRLTSPVKSYRLYFRDDYGADRFAPGLLFDPASEPLRRLILHNDIRFDHQQQPWYFIRPLAYDIGRRIGAIVPAVSPALMLLNGSPQGVYFLTEYIDRYYLQSRYGHDQFVLVRKQKMHPVHRFDDPLALGNRETWQEFTRWGLEHSRLTMAEAGERFDVKNLTDWFLTVLFCGTTDSLQGPLLLDESRSDARWFWITWDMDHSFKIEWDWQPGDETWDIDIFESVLEKDGRRIKKSPRLVRTSLLRRLLRRAEYRRYLADRIQEMLNHQLTPEFLRGRYEHYMALAERFGIENPAFNEAVGPYLENRPAKLREQTVRRLRLRAAHPVRIEIGAGCDADIDGYRHSGSYSGWYFESRFVTVKNGATCRETFSHWEIDSPEGRQTVSSPTLRHRVRGATTIRLVRAPAAAPGALAAAG